MSGVVALLLAQDAERPLASGDVVRITEGEIQGIRNRSSESFVYLSVTAPPIDFQRLCTCLVSYLSTISRSSGSYRPIADVIPISSFRVFVWSKILQAKAHT